MSAVKILFQVDLNDSTGDIVQNGVFLWFENTAIRVCDSPDDFPDIVRQIQGIAHEIATGEPMNQPEAGREVK